MATQHFAYDKRLVWRAIAVSAVVLVLAASVVLLMRDPTLPQWLYYLVVLALPYYTYKLMRETLKIVRPSPAVTVSDKGIIDLSWGHDLIPWRAVVKIQVTRVWRKSGGVFFFLDAGEVESMPGPIHMRVSNWLRGVRAGQAGQQIVLMMTPSVALKSNFDDVLDALERHATPAGVPIEDNPADRRSKE